HVSTTRSLTEVHNAFVSISFLQSHLTVLRKIRSHSASSFKMVLVRGQSSSMQELLISSARMGSFLVSTQAHMPNTQKDYSFLSLRKLCRVLLLFSGRTRECLMIYQAD